jgi:hypothetical protein
MISEANIAGIYLAPIVIDVAVAIPVFWLIRTLLARVGFWRRVWHPALFEAALFLSIVSLLVLA